MDRSELDQLLAYLAGTPEFVAGVVNCVSAAQLLHRPGISEFSLIEQVCHLRDIEAEGYTIRIEKILTEDSPLLSDLDGSRLAIERDYQSQDLVPALSSFTKARAANVARLRTMSRDELDRTGQFEGSGTITLSRLVQLMGEHDATHREEIDGLRVLFANISITAG